MFVSPSSQYLLYYSATVERNVFCTEMSIHALLLTQTPHTNLFLQYSSLSQFPNKGLIKLSQVVTFLTFTREVPGSNLSRITDNLD